ncbi:MAG: hypothetical protein HY671_01155 [Chloroflexi bacterium]|nr:hypothetical protein [Chloroflexota bacterium]
MLSTFNYPIRVYSADRSRGVKVDVLVDAASTYTWIPRSILEKLGYRPAFRAGFEIANGTTVESDVAEVVVGLNGEVGATRVGFAEPGEPSCLGAVTLEEFLLAPDPVHQKLIPVTGLRI